MGQKNVFFDFDGMKFDTMPFQIAYINYRYNINTSESDHIGQNNSLDAIVKRYRPDLTLSRDEIYHDFGVNFISSIKWHENVQPMPDMPEVAREISKKYTLFVATGRQRRGLHVIEHLLNKHVPGCISYIHCVWQHTDDGKFIGVQKKDFISKIPGDNVAFFDDSMHEIEDTKDTIPSYLFDPKNTHANTKNLLRVESWRQIGDMLL